MTEPTLVFPTTTAARPADRAAKSISTQYEVDQIITDLNNLVASGFGVPVDQTTKPCNSAPALHLPTEAVARKSLPVYSGFLKYFPDAMVAVAELSRIGNDQHNPGKPLQWDRSKSGDELDALSRHLLDAGDVDTDGIRHSTKVAWRAMANLQKEIEAAKRPNNPNMFQQSGG